MGIQKSHLQHQDCCIIKTHCLQVSLQIAILNQLCSNSISWSLNLCAPPFPEVYRQAQDIRTIVTKQQMHILALWSFLSGWTQWTLLCLTFCQASHVNPSSGSLPPPAFALTFWLLRNARGSQETGVVWDAAILFLFFIFLSSSMFSILYSCEAQISYPWRLRTTCLFQFKLAH